MTEPAVPVAYSPYDYELHEDPYPTYARPSRRGARVPQRGVRLLRLLPLRRRRRGLQGRRALLEQLRRLARPERVLARGAPHHVLPRHGPAPPHADEGPRRPGLLAPARGRDGGPCPGAHASPSRARPRGGHLRHDRRPGRQAADGRRVRPRRGARARPGRASASRRPRAAPRGGALRRPPGRHGGRHLARRLLLRDGGRAPASADGRPHLRTARGRGRRRTPHRGGDRRLSVLDGRGRERDHDQAPRQRLVLGVAQPRRAVRPLRRPGGHTGLGGRDAALRHLEPGALAGDDGRGRTARRGRPLGRTRAAARRVGQPRPPAVPRRRPVRPRPRHLQAHQLRRRSALLHGRVARPPRGPRRPRGALPAGRRLRRRRGASRAGALQQRAGFRHVADDVEVR